MTPIDVVHAISDMALWAGSLLILTSFLPMSSRWHETLFLLCVGFVLGGTAMGIVRIFLP